MPTYVTKRKAKAAASGYWKKMKVHGVNSNGDAKPSKKTPQGVLYGYGFLRSFGLNTFIDYEYLAQFLKAHKSVATSFIAKWNRE